MPRRGARRAIHHSDPLDPDDAGRGRQAALPLFETGGAGAARPSGHVALIPDLTAEASLEVARYWFRRHLEQSEHPKNTVKSYSYDLSIFEILIGPKRIDEIQPRDIAYYLDDATTRSTRKRRLTSISALFKFLIGTTKVLESDPTADFYPTHIPLKTPRPLFEEEQERLLAAAAEDGTRARAAIWLMLRLGLTRAELLNLHSSHIDPSDPDQPVVYIYYENPRNRGKERKLLAGPEFAPIFEELADEYAPLGKLLPILPQSVNKLVDRVTLAAGINKPVSPQLLRDTFAVERARQGAGEDDLLALLGLANDARNRMSVQRYLKLASPPLLSE